MYLCVDINTYKYIYIHTYTYIYIYINMYIYIQTYAYTFIDRYRHIHMWTHTHIISITHRRCQILNHSQIPKRSTPILSPMEWLWSVGSIKLQVSFAKEPYGRDHILQTLKLIEPADRSFPYLNPNAANATCQTLNSNPLVGSIKLQVSFAEYGLFYMALLQKRPIV